MACFILCNLLQRDSISILKTFQFVSTQKKKNPIISQEVRILSDKERAVVHVAAVVVNNFTNHLLHIGEKICAEEGLDYNILKPLIQETVEKTLRKSPYDMQTGPARRGDQQTIQKHTDYLKKFPEYQSLYTLLSKSITNTYS